MSAEQAAADGGTPPHHRSSLAERLARRRERHMRRSKLYRVLFGIAGALVTLAGVAMLALPGPAFVVIPIGLAMLALEFKWAERALEKALDKAEQARDSARNASPAHKALGMTLTVLGIAAFVAAAILWDIPVLPV
jgi:uncharacterized protein (TIGR02611 family)